MSVATVMGMSVASGRRDRAMDIESGFRATATRRSAPRRRASVHDRKPLRLPSLTMTHTELSNTAAVIEKRSLECTPTGAGPITMSQSPASSHSAACS